MKFSHRIAGVVAIAATAFALSASSASASSCAASGSTTQLHQGDIRVYTTPWGSSGGALYVCSTYYGLHILLQRSSHYKPYVNRDARAGYRTFAYALYDRLVGSVDLQTGSSIRHHYLPNPDVWEGVTALRVRLDGSIAYIYSWNYGNTHSENIAVGKHDTTGIHDSLDSGCVLCTYDIDPNYLNVAGNTVYWKRSDGTTHTAYFA